MTRRIWNAQCSQLAWYHLARNTGSIQTIPSTSNSFVRSNSRIQGRTFRVIHLLLLNRTTDHRRRNGSSCQRIIGFDNDITLSNLQPKTSMNAIILETKPKQTLSNKGLSHAMQLGIFILPNREFPTTRTCNTNNLTQPLPPNNDLADIKAHLIML